MHFTKLIHCGLSRWCYALILSWVVLESVDANPSGQQFRRVTVDDRPIGQRINIQIEPQKEEPTFQPEVEPQDLPGQDVAVIPPPALDTAAWFWTRFSPTLESASVLSLQTALRIDGPEADALNPSLTSLQELVVAYGPFLLRAGAEMEVSPALLLAIMYVESRGRADAVSPAGAEGVMQLIPATAQRFGVSNSMDPADAIIGAAKYVNFLLDEFGGDAILALAGYNAGENAVLNHGGVPPYAETRDYIPKVVAAWRIARRLCTGPQDYATDGCVFVNMG